VLLYVALAEFVTIYTVFCLINTYFCVRVWVYMCMHAQKGGGRETACVGFFCVCTCLWIHIYKCIYVCVPVCSRMFANVHTFVCASPSWLLVSQYSSISKAAAYELGKWYSVPSKRRNSIPCHCQISPCGPTRLLPKETLGIGIFVQANVPRAGSWPWTSILGKGLEGMVL
jgi:hypothetical protein